MERCWNVRSWEPNQFWINACQRSHSHLSPVIAKGNQKRSTAVSWASSLCGRAGTERSRGLAESEGLKPAAALLQTVHRDTDMLQDVREFTVLRPTPAHSGGGGARRGIDGFFGRSQDADGFYGKGLCQLNQADIIGSQD